MRTAVIIPTLHDEAGLARLLARLARLDPAADEVIVVDGAASPACELTCRSAHAQWLPVRGGRGGQLALGAARARADVLWFLQPHCEPPLAAVTAIRTAVAARAVGGYFRFQLGGAPTAFKGLIERGIAWRSRWGMVYSDQGIFVTRAAYADTPGFAVQPLFEEVAMVRALKRTGRFVALPAPIAVSPSRWEREGYLRRTAIDRALALGFLCGISAARLARWQGERLRPAAPDLRSRHHATADSPEAHKL
ncbi:MAG TPA: glycosyltransferase [Steroidobacteraceae bacterium]|nr:glycosyltransferase [Steroidobacteraceae bacterium]